MSIDSSPSLHCALAVVFTAGAECCRVPGCGYAGLAAHGVPINPPSPIPSPPHHPISAAVTAGNQVLLAGCVNGPTGHKDFAFYM